MQFFFFFSPPLAQWYVRKLKDVSRCHLSLNVCLCRYLGNTARYCRDLCKGHKLCETSSLLQPGCVTHSPAFTALQALIINFRAYVKKKKKSKPAVGRRSRNILRFWVGRERISISPPHTPSTTLHLSLLIISERNLTHCQCLWTLDIIRPAWRQIS